MLRPPRAGAHGLRHRAPRQGARPTLTSHSASKTGRKTQAVYIADFTYYELPENTLVIADFKGIDTKLSQLKRAILQTMLPDARIVVQYAKSNSSRRSSHPRKKKK